MRLLSKSVFKSYEPKLKINKVIFILIYYFFFKKLEDIKYR